MAFYNLCRVVCVCYIFSFCIPFIDLIGNCRSRRCSGFPYTIPFHVEVKGIDADLFKKS